MNVVKFLFRFVLASIVTIFQGAVYVIMIGLTVVHYVDGVYWFAVPFSLGLCVLLWLAYFVQRDVWHWVAKAEP